MKEAEFQAAVMELAQVCGWLRAHFRPAQNLRGQWRTAVAGDGKGFPDLVLVHPDRGVVFAELKSERGRTTPEQDRWLEVLAEAGARVHLWRPDDWDDIEALLTGRSCSSCGGDPADHAHVDGHCHAGRS